MPQGERFTPGVLLELIQGGTWGMGWGKGGDNVQNRWGHLPFLSVQCIRKSCYEQCWKPFEQSQTHSLTHTRCNARTS